MRLIIFNSLLAMMALSSLESSSNGGMMGVEARKPTRPVARAGRPPPRPMSSRSAPPRRRRPEIVEDEEVDDFPMGLDDDDDDDDESDASEPTPKKSRRPPPNRRRRRPPTRAAEYDDDEEEEDDWGADDGFDDDDDEIDGYDDDEEEIARPPPRRSGRRPPPQRRPPPRRPGGGGGRPRGRNQPVVRYQKPESSLSRGWSAFRERLPDAGTIKNTVGSGLSTVKDATTGISSNLYRDIKGLTSSELEQVMLKATRPDDTAVKGKHVERLVGVTYQISARYDIYDAVLRKLWKKMAEKDWRTTVKALYILHRFSADGAPEHAAALKARLRELRRTRDPKRKDKFFNSKQLLAGTATPENAPFRAFLSRYAHYVILRAQCFGGLFDEISAEPAKERPKKKKGNAAATPPKPITATALRKEHLEAASMLLKAALACQLQDGEECENTAIAVERVCSDLMGLCAAVAVAVNRTLKKNTTDGVDDSLLQKWCQLYQDELLPKTKEMVKRSSKKLDPFGLYLPSRMGTSIAPEVLERGLGLGNGEDDKKDAPAKEDDEPESEEPKAAKKEPVEQDNDDDDDNVEDNDDQVEDEYEYEDEEYYDEEEL